MKRVRRCSHPTLGKPKCRKMAVWRVTGYYNGRPQFTVHFCQRHMRQWEATVKKVVEESGVLSQEWSFDIRKLSR
jgi:hypothetical protein